MSRRALVLFVLFSSVFAAAHAEPISTKTCTTEKVNVTKTQNGKTYKCDSVEHCTTTTCQEGSAHCTVTKQDNYSCVEQISGRPGRIDVLPGRRPDVLDPGTSAPPRRPLETVPRGEILQRQ